VYLLARSFKSKEGNHSEWYVEKSVALGGYRLGIDDGVQ
jgi:hypothetical protein